MTPRKTIVYIAMSVDGYIAGPSDDLSFLNAVQAAGEDYGYHQFMSGIETVILGRKTYDWVMTQVDEFPHVNLETYVITRTQKAAVGKTQFYTGDLSVLINKLKEKEGGNIFIDGGAQLVQSLLQLKLVDEMIISIIPVLLGAGTKLFASEYPVSELILNSSNKFDSGLVQLHYSVKQVD